MKSEPLEVRVSVIFDYWAAYIGGKKIKIDGLKRHTQSDYLLMTYFNADHQWSSKWAKNPLFSREDNDPLDSREDSNPYGFREDM